MDSLPFFFFEATCLPFYTYMDGTKKCVRLDSLFIYMLLCQEQLPPIPPYFEQCLILTSTKLSWFLLFGRKIVISSKLSRYSVWHGDIWCRYLCTVQCSAVLEILWPNWFLNTSIWLSDLTPDLWPFSPLLTSMVMACFPITAQQSLSDYEYSSG